MNKLLLVLGFVLSQGIVSISAQQISQDQKLATTAKVWGFLKYYHPQVAKGKFDWDAQLLEILPKVAQAENKEELSKIYLDWISALGEVPLCKKCAKEENQTYFDKNFDLSWIDDADVFTEQLSNKLRFIEQNRFQGKHHYVSVKYKQVGNISLENEPEYNDLDWQNPDMRLLIGFKYWNIIEYFFPYKYQTDQPWEEVLLETIPKLRTAPSEVEFHNALQQMVVKIDDSHGWFISSSDTKTYKLPAFKTKFINEKLVVIGHYKDSLAALSPLIKGDVIVALNDKPIEALIEENLPFAWGSNKASKFRTLNSMVLRFAEKSQGKVKFIRNGEIKEAKINYFPMDDLKPVPSNLVKWKIMDGNIGYVDMGHLMNEEVDAMMDDLMATDGIIFDVRNYPKGTMYNIAAYLIPERRYFYKFIIPDLTYPGRFKWQGGGICGNPKSKSRYKGNITLLVNERTQSHAEFTVMALQAADKVVTVGSKTSGADGNVTRLNLGAGAETNMSGIGIFYPDGTETQRKGIKVDVEVHPTIEGIRAGRDEVLEKALEIAKR